MKPKPRPIQAETQGWLEQRFIRPIQAKVDADEEDQQRVNEKKRSWSNPLKQVEKKRLIRPIEVESEWGVREKEKISKDKREKKWEKQRPTETRERKKINKIIINEIQ